MRNVFLGIILFCLIASPVLAEEINWCDSAKACWLFEDGSGTTVSDDSSSYDLTMSGSPSWKTSSPPGSFSTYYIDFDGWEYLYGYGIASWGDATIVQWVNPDTVDLNEYAGFSQYDHDFGGEGHALKKSSSGDGKWQYRLEINGNEDNTYSNSAPSGGWQHIAGVYDYPVMTLYVDGVLQTDTGSVAVGSINTTQSNAIKWGADPWGNAFEGQGDETAYFEAALDSTDIDSVMLGLVHEEEEAETWLPRTRMF